MRHSSIVRLADELLSLRLSSLGLLEFVPELVAVDVADPENELRVRYRVLCEEIASFLTRAALTMSEIQDLVRLRRKDPETHDWWHVYSYSVYCLLLIVERYGQELGASKGSSSRTLRFGVNSEWDLFSHVDSVFEGAPFHSLSTFIFMGFGALRLKTLQRTYYVDAHSNWCDVGRNPFAVTGVPSAVRGPTSVDTRPFTDVLVCGELAGYRVNEVVFSLIDHASGVATQSLESLRRAIDEAIACIQAVREAYQRYNASAFSPAIFAGVVRQFTVALDKSPSDWVAEALERPLTAETSQFIDHLLFSLNLPVIDERLLRALSRDVDHVSARSDSAAVKAAASNAVRALSFDGFFSRVGAARALLELVCTVFDLPLDSAAHERCAWHIVKGTHAQVPSGSVSAAHAVCDMFFGAQHVATYWAHLLNRYAAMAPRDRASIDRLWNAQDLLAEKETWYDRARSAFAGDAELSQRLETFKCEFGRMGLAHKAVVTRFVRNPGKRQRSVFGANSTLISNLEQGTTGMRFEIQDLLSQLATFRQGLLT